MDRKGIALVIGAMTIILLSFVGLLLLDAGKLRAYATRAQADADAVALAAASGLISAEDSVWIRARMIAEANKAQIDTLVYDTETGQVTVWIGVDTGPLFACVIGGWLIRACDRLGGPRIRRAAGATPSVVSDGRGTPVPPGNAFGWYKNEKKHVRDSAIVRLNQ